MILAKKYTYRPGQKIKRVSPSNDKKALISTIENVFLVYCYSRQRCVIFGKGHNNDYLGCVNCLQTCPG